MDNSIELLQKQLEEKIARLDKENADRTAAFNKEQEERRIIEAAERAERVKKIKESEERVIARKAEIEAAEIKRQQEATEARIKAEQALNEQQELVRKQREKLEWLENEIAKADYVQEQHEKSLAYKPAPIEEIPETDEAIVNAHIKTGEAAAGTDGLEVGPNLSAHLRSILRRANSDVN